jgi:hypothetical protein
VRGVARTAVVAGTAAAVAGGVRHRQEQRWAGQEQEAAAQQAAQEQQYAAQQAAYQNQAELEQTQQQLAAMQAQQAQAATPAPQPLPAPSPPAPPPPPAAPAGSDLTTQLNQLAQLKAAGVLTDEEFAAAKAKLLSGG